MAAEAAVLVLGAAPARAVVLAVEAARGPAARRALPPGPAQPQRQRPPLRRRLRRPRQLLQPLERQRHPLRQRPRQLLLLLQRRRLLQSSAASHADTGSTTLGEAVVEAFVCDMTSLNDLCVDGHGVKFTPCLCARSWPLTASARAHQINPRPRPVKDSVQGKRRPSRPRPGRWYFRKRTVGRGRADVPLLMRVEGGNQHRRAPPKASKAAVRLDRVGVSERSITDVDGI